MKRFLLPAILLFPLASLIFWIYWGSSHRQTFPKATEADTNAAVVSPNALAGK
jgi:hypothetical protein